ncbi:MAG TPA: cysteine desulfurase family protein [Candidatus Dormibacteraeota bacterium]
MSSAAVYLDHAATTPVAAEVLEVMLPHLAAHHGNPSSVHASGRVARAAVDEARERVAAALGCRAAEVVFTSGGSEADNLALRGVVDRSGGGHVVVSAIEHDAVLHTAEQLAEQGRITLTVVGCDGRGVVDPLAVAAAVTPETVLVSVMLANNEVGTIQDVAAIAAAVRARNPGTLVHTDAVQALGKLEVDVVALGVDLCTVTAHKAYGPKGAGALVVRRGVALAAQVSGGGQERARRAGTENVAAIAGFGAACSLVIAEREREQMRLAALSEHLIETVVSGVPDVVVTGAGGPRLASFATFAFPGLITEVLLVRLDQLGVEASGGSACSSGASMPSHVLAAMGLPAHTAGGALRLTLGRGTTEAGVERAGAAVIDAVQGARAILGVGAATA